MVNGCYLCKRTAKSHNHVLLWCSVSFDLRLCASFGI